MCLAIPGKIISLNNRLAQVQYPEVVSQAMIMDVTADVGDYVMVQMGVVVKKLDIAEAQARLAAWKETE